MLDGSTRLIAHIGYPTESFKAPLIYNPYFTAYGFNFAVVPMGIREEDFTALFRQLFRMSNMYGALITMPHKVSSVALLDTYSPAVSISGACNAVIKRADGSLHGDMFDGEGFVRGLARKGFQATCARALVIGAGGVGSAIAAALAAAGVAHLGLYDVNSLTMNALAARLLKYYPALQITLGSNNPENYDLVVNATPLGTQEGDEMPVDVTRLSPRTFVGDVVMSREITPFLAAAIARGCPVQIGLDMLFEMIPAYLNFFGFPEATPDELRAISPLKALV